MPIGILASPERNVNKQTIIISNKSNDFEILEISDVLEIIKILLYYNVKNKKRQDW